MPTTQGSGVATPISERDWRSDIRPLVSVLCPTFNQENFIGPCLDSVLGQIASFPVEIIVHDDASTDGTAAVVRSYQEKYPQIIKPIFQTENQLTRRRKARPIMLEHAKGAFVASCDGDDRWLDPHKLTKQVDFLLRNPSFVLSFHDAVHMSADGRKMEKHGVLPASARRDYSQAELSVLKWGWMLLGTVVHRNIGLDFPPEYGIAKNGDVFLPMLLASGGGAKFQPEVAPLAYRQHSASMTSMKPPREKKQRVLQTYLLIASYFVRIGEIERAEEILTVKLGRPPSRQWLEFWASSRS